MKKFKVGDLVRMKEDCSGCEAGKVYPLHSTNRRGEPSEDLWAWDGTVEVGRDGCFSF